MTSSETKPMRPETTNVVKKTVTTHRIVRKRSFLEASVWDFATEDSPRNRIVKEMTAAGRINLTA